MQLDPLKQGFMPPGVSWRCVRDNDGCMMRQERFLSDMIVLHNLAETRVILLQDD